LTSSVTHFEIYAEEPPKLAEFYQSLFGWRVEQAPGIDYWRIQCAADTANGLNGGLTYRPFPGPRSWVHYVHVDSFFRPCRICIARADWKTYPRARCTFLINV
jgi:predicted enzyme related to lactoylglutathione lyase